MSVSAETQDRPRLAQRRYAFFGGGKTLLNLVTGHKGGAGDYGITVVTCGADARTA